MHKSNASQRHEEEETTLSHGGVDNVIDARGIRDPRSGEIMSVAEAISHRVLDVRNGRIVTSADGQGSMTIEEAAKAGLIDATLAARLLRPCAMAEGGRQVSLLEAIQRELCDAERKDGDRVKVISSEAVEGCSVADASQLARTHLDPETGQFVLENGERVTLEEARVRGHLVHLDTSVRIKKGAMPLSDAIAQDLLEERLGRVVDRNTGQLHCLDEAVSAGIIDGSLKEVVDARSDDKLTVDEALERGILNAKIGRYVNEQSMEKLTFKEAKRRRLIAKPATLKDCCDLEIIDDKGMIASPTRRAKLSILEAMQRNVLDVDGVKSIVDTKTGESLTLSEALEQGVILPDGRYRDLANDRLMTIPEAVDAGLITSNAQKSIFDIEGFKDPLSNEFISLNSALRKGLVTAASEGGGFVVDLKTGKTISFAEAATSGHARDEVLEMLNRAIGVFDDGGRELTVLEAVLTERLDSHTGQLLLDPHNKTPVPLEDAIKCGLITPDGAALLDSLLNISVTTRTVTKKVVPSKRPQSLTGKSEESNSEAESCSDDKVDFSHSRVNYSPPKAIGTTTTIITRDSSSSPEKLRETEVEPRNVTRVTITPIATSISSPDWSMEKEQSLSPAPSNKTSELSPMSPMLEGSVSPTQHDGDQSLTEAAEASQRLIEREREAAEKMVVEMPSEGWMLSEAIAQKLFDPVTGLFIIPGTDRLVSFEECVKLQIINPTSAVVVDPKNDKRKLSLMRSLEKGVLDSTGHYSVMTNRVSMKEAIAKELIILEDRAPIEVSNSAHRLLQITRVSGGPDKVEVAHADDFTKQTEIVSSEELSTLDPVMVSQGIIYDPATALVISTETGRSTNLMSAVNDGTLAVNAIVVKDPESGAEMAVDEAVNRGILDLKAGVYNDGSGRKISLADAAKFGVIAVLGAPLVAAAAAVEAVKRTMVKDPRTGENIPREVAIERGIVNRGPDSKRSSYADKSDEARTPVDDNSAEGSSLADQTRARVTTEPKYKVTIGRAKSFSQSPEREARPIVLQKMRKKIVKPQEALESGIINEETARVLETATELAEGESPREARVVDPQRGDLLSVTEAVERGIVDMQGGNLLIPIGKSLTIPELCQQGLLDPHEGKIIHPETGAHLTLHEAIVCDIVDPLSRMSTEYGENVTLQEAIDRHIVNPDTCTVMTERGKVNLLKAIEKDLFEEPSDNVAESPIPLIGMTFDVALKRGLIDTRTKQVTHPVTGERISLEEAIANEFIMAVPYPPAADCIDVVQALEAGLIDASSNIFVHPTTGTPVEITQAVESGLLMIKPETAEEGAVTAITETVTAYHTITTKMIQLSPGYTLLNTMEVVNLATGQTLSVEEAQQRGIMRDESDVRTAFAAKDVKLNINEALEQGLLDIEGGTYQDPLTGDAIPISKAVELGVLDTSLEKTAEESSSSVASNLADKVAKESTTEEVELTDDSLIYNVQTSEYVTMKEAVERGAVDKKTGRIKVKGNESMSIKDAAKLGLVAVIAAPILAGKAVIDAVKSRDRASSSRTIVVKTVEAVQSESRDEFSDGEGAKFLESDEVGLRVPVNRDLTARRLAELGAYDEQIEKFIDPSSGEIIPFSDFVLALEVFDPDTCLVKDLTSRDGRYVTLREAVEKPLVDRNIGYMVEPRSGKRIPFFQAVQLGLITEQVELEKPGLTMKEAEERIICESMPGELEAATPELLNLQKAIEANLIDPSKAVIKHPTTGRFVTVKKALEDKLVEPTKTLAQEESTGKVSSNFVKFEDVTVFLTHPLSLSSAIEGHHLSLETGKFTDPKSNASLSLKEAVTAGIIDPDSAMIKDTEKKKLVKLTEAFRRGIMDVDKGSVLETSTYKLHSLARAIDSGLLITEKRALPFIDSIEYGIYEPSSGLFRDPFVDSKSPGVSLAEAIDAGLVDPSSCIVKNPVTGAVNSLLDSINLEQVDAAKGRLVEDVSGASCDFARALERGYVLAAEARVRTKTNSKALIINHCPIFFFFFINIQLLLWNLYFF